MNISTMNHQLFKRREREVGNAVENVARESCTINSNFRKKMAAQSPGPSADGFVGIAVSYDMGWQKRGKGTIPQPVIGLPWGLLQEKW